MSLSSSAFWILTSLANGRRHGYQILRETALLSEGAARLKPTTLYATLERLEGKGLIRSEVGKALGIRLTPSLTFQLDALPTTAKTLEDALAQARVRDAQIAKAAEGATYAGEADPYRHDDEDTTEADENDEQTTVQEPARGAEGL